MKKIYAFLMALIMMFSLTACDGSGNTSSSKEHDNDREEVASSEINGGSISNPTVTPGLGLNEDTWNTAIQTEMFNNVTFSYEATFIGGLSSGYSSDSTECGTIKLAENGMLNDGDFSNDKDLMQTAKSLFIDTAVAMLSNYNQYEYNEANDTYKSNEPITYSTNVESYEANIIAENVVVKFDHNSNIATISCKMTQNFTEEGSPKTFVLDLVMNFWDYGTTVVEEPK